MQEGFTTEHPWGNEQNCGPMASSDTLCLRYLHHKWNDSSAKHFNPLQCY